jgi:hypothetical protein
MKKVQRGGACSTHGRDEKYTIYLENLKGRDNIRMDLGQIISTTTTTTILQDIGHSRPVPIQNLISEHLVVLLGRGISPTQGLYLHRTTQHRKKQTHPCLDRDSYLRCQFSSGGRQYVP